MIVSFMAVLELAMDGMMNEYADMLNLLHLASWLLVLLIAKAANG